MKKLTKQEMKMYLNRNRTIISLSKIIGWLIGWGITIGIILTIIVWIKWGITNLL